MKRRKNRLDITPSWRGVAHIIYDVLRNPKSTKAEKDEMYSELKRMALAADKYNKIVNSDITDNLN